MDAEVSDRMKNSIMYKMSYYRFGEVRHRSVLGRAVADASRFPYRLLRPCVCLCVCVSVCMCVYLCFCFFVSAYMLLMLTRVGDGRLSCLCLYVCVCIFARVSLCVVLTLVYLGDCLLTCLCLVLTLEHPGGL